MAQSKFTSQPTKLWYQTSFEVGGPAKFIDIAQSLSLISNRLHRQAQNFAVANMNIHLSQTGVTDQAVIDVRTVPKTWIVDNATTKAYALWQEQRREALKEINTNRARWSDFKVFLDSEHFAIAGITGAGNLVPHNGMAPGVVTPYSQTGSEWRYSEIALPNITGGAGTFETALHVCGNNSPAGVINPATIDSTSMVQAYIDSRGTVLTPDPQTPTNMDTSLYGIQIGHDDMTESLVDETVDSNDLPPYNKDDVPHGNANVVNAALEARLYPNDYGNTVTNPVVSSSTGPFIAPFGLIKIEAPVIADLNGLVIEIDLVHGKSKGIMAERGV